MASGDIMRLTGALILWAHEEKIRISSENINFILHILSMI